MPDLVLTTRIYFPDDGSGNAQNAYDHLVALMQHAQAAGRQVGAQIDTSWVRLHDCYVAEDEGATDRCTTVAYTQVSAPDPGGTPVAWEPGLAVQAGTEPTLVTYQGTTYRCLQAHTTQAGWEPPATPALWQPI